MSTVEGWEVAEPAPPPRRRRRPALVAVLAVVLLGAGTATGFVLTGDGGPDQPDRWDPRVIELVEFVERERGLEFEHPVRIDFLDDAAFRREMTEDDELTEEEREQLESVEAMLRALGLVSGDVDLESIGDELVGDGVVGVYEFEDERILVRGETLDDQRRSTLVHELVHALQDQHFDIGDMEPEGSGAQAAFTAVVEADAVAVQDAWRETLSAEARQALDAADAGTSAGADFEGVPDVFVELMAFPYAFGPDFLDSVVEAKGTAGRNELFTELPTTEEHIIVPRTYLDEQRAEKVFTPELEAGEALVEESEEDFGMLSLLVVLGERIDFSTAWGGVQGWAGDAMVAFERAGRTCVRARVAFDETAHAERFVTAFDEWADGLPATQRRDGRFVTFESCDPGGDAPGGRAEGHVSAIQGLGLRQAIADGFEGTGAPPAAAECIADGLLARLGTNRVAELDRLLTANPDDPARREIERTVIAVVPTCR